MIDCYTCFAFPVNFVYQPSIIITFAIIINNITVYGTPRRILTDYISNYNALDYFYYATNSAFVKFELFYIIYNYKTFATGFINFISVVCAKSFTNLNNCFAFYILTL